MITVIFIALAPITVCAEGTLQEKANTYIEKKNYEAAEPILEKLLNDVEMKVRSKDLSNHPNLPKTSIAPSLGSVAIDKDRNELAVCPYLDKLALVYEKQGKFKEAEKCYLRLLELYGSSVRSAARKEKCLDDMAMFYLRCGNLQQAEKYEKEVLKDDEDFYPYNPQHPMHLEHMACIYQVEKKFADAELMYKDEMDFYEYLCGDELVTIEVTPQDIKRLLNLYAELLRQTNRQNEVANMQKDYRIRLGTARSQKTKPPPLLGGHDTHSNDLTTDHRGKLPSAWGPLEWPSDP